MLQMETTALVLIDVQGKLAFQVDGSMSVLDNLKRLIKAARLYELPVVMVEQCPRDLGPTVPEIKGLLPEITAAEKNTFDACLSDDFFQRIKECGKEQLLVAGIEAHVCVYQTVAGLLRNGYEVSVACDAVSSRTACNRETALQRMRELGALITTTEMALFELVKIAAGDRFRRFVDIVK